MSAAAAPPKQIGAYEVLGKIAEGGMGAVYKARHPATGELVAIKVVPAETAKNPTLLRRFEQEFRAASLIDHPNVVKAIEYGGGPTPFLVMEYVDGESLGQRVERAGPVPEAEAVRVIGQVCEGLHRAHKQGLIHRDVKPDNILLATDGVAKLTDLGLVKDVEAETNLTRTGRGLGTPHFMAPEQFRNAKFADVRCDVYSLGATLYCMVTGKIPFLGTTPIDCWMKKTKSDLPPAKELVPILGERVNWAICRAMHHDPAVRPASCREFMEELTGLSWRGQTSGSHVRPNPTPLPADLPPPPSDEPADLWYMVYRGPTGKPKTVKGTTESIRRNAAGGQIGVVETVLVSRTKVGPFLTLSEVPEFADLFTPVDDSTPLPEAAVVSRYVVAPEMAASLSGRAVAPTEPMPAADPAAADTTELYTVTPLLAPRTHRPPDRPAPLRQLATALTVTAVVMLTGLVAALLLR